MHLKVQMLLLQSCTALWHCYNLFCFWMLYEQWELVFLRAAVRGEPGVPHMRGSSHSLSLAGLCKTLGPNPSAACLPCRSPGISGSWPTVGCISLGINMEAQPSACSHGTGRQLRAESRSRVNLVLPGKAGSALGCHAWGLPGAEGWCPVRSQGVSQGAGRCPQAKGG